MKQIITYRSKVVIGLVALALTLSFGVLFPSNVAWATGNFHGTVNISIDTSGADICDLTASGIDESGLGFTNVTYQLNANATLGLACRNNGGNFPSDPKKNASGGEVSGETTVGVKNGRVRGASVTIDISEEVPVPLSCPGGQRAVVVCCNYSNISLVDTTSDPDIVAAVSTTSASFTLQGAPASLTGLCD
jgi:hypothetical protein